MRCLLLVAADAFISGAGIGGAIAQTTKAIPSVLRDPTGIPGKNGATLVVDPVDHPQLDRGVGQVA